MQESFLPPLQLPELIKIYVSLQPDTIYEPRAFDKAQSYINKELELPVRFEFTDDIPENLDQRTKIAMIEPSSEEYKERSSLMLYEIKFFFQKQIIIKLFLLLMNMIVLFLVSRRQKQFISIV